MASEFKAVRAEAQEFAKIADVRFEFEKLEHRFDKKFDKLESRFDKLENEATQLRHEINAKISELENATSGGFDNLETRINDLTSEINRMRSDLASMQLSLTQNQSRLDDHIRRIRSVEDYGLRLSAIEASLADTARLAQTPDITAKLAHTS